MDTPLAPPGLEEAPLRAVLAPLVDAGDLAVLLGDPLFVERLDPAVLLEGLAGLRPETKARLAAAMELARRRALAVRPKRPRLRRARDVVSFLRPRFLGQSVESFRVLLLDARHAVQGEVLVSQGTLSTSLVHPREVFRPAVLAPAASVIVAHNHPSGDAEPSSEDHAVTRRLARCGELLGIPLLDHVILGEPDWWSYREAGHAALATPRWDAEEDPSGT